LASESSTIDERIRAFERTKAFSTLLLVLVTALFVASRILEPRHPWLAIVAAFAEAAMIGALADWFAVVALFRHPLGIPLPHTAIIPNNKGRIAENLGAFVTGNFLRTEVILERIRAFDPASRFARWLSSRDAAEKLAAYATKLLVYGLAALEDRRVQHFIRAAVVRQLGQIDFSALAGQFLDILTQDRRHHQLLNASIHQVKLLLQDEATQEKIGAIVAREFESWRKFTLGFKVDEILGDAFAKKIVSGVARLIDEIDADEDHPLRRRFDLFTAEFVEKMKRDPEFRLKGEQIRDQLLERPELAGYLGGLWAQFRDWLRDDLSAADSSTRARVVEATLELAGTLSSDREMQAWMNEQLIAAAAPLGEKYRAEIAKFISDQVKAWDDRYMVQQVELNIGRDLQFVRINGTLIGGMIGLLLYGCTQLLHG